MEAIVNTDKTVKGGHDLDDLNSLSYKQFYSGGKLNVVTNFVQKKDPILVGHRKNKRIRLLTAQMLLVRTREFDF